uniref:Solute carrier family 13 member 3 n=1 Tax=Magallana gigas TaxID=29159 RepID=K1QSI6_MAGGI
MLPCWFLSMWMSNTATTAMMVPILGAILHVMRESMTQEPVEETELVEEPEKSRVNGTTVVETLEGEEVVVKGRDRDEESRDGELDSITPNEEFVRLTKTFALCTAFAANIGGMATLTGTPPNIILKTIADELFEKAGGDSGISFANWLIIGLPLSLICLVITWLWLQVLYSRKKFQETVVLIVFIILALLWMTRNPQVVPGWGDLFEKGYTGDSIAAVLITAFLFAFPSQLPCLVKAKKRDVEESTDELRGEVEEPSEEEKWKFQPLLDWDTVNQKIPWGVLLLMGGGFAVAEACESSGLSEWVSSQLADVMRNMTTSSAALLLSLMVAAATNVTSNTATATLFLPIVGELAIDLGVHPLSFMIPVAISCSFAFMLPVGTPPNAIVFSTGYLKVKDMVVGGSLVNLVTVLILILAMMLWITPFYNLNEFPEVFKVAKNLTQSAVNGTGSIDINLPYNVTA